jgi:subtilisin family serine protease
MFLQIFDRMIVLVSFLMLGAGCVETTTVPSPVASTSGGFAPWMSEDVKAAWAAGYRGQGSTITVVDSYSGRVLTGKLQDKVEQRSHGGWTSWQAQLIAPDANARTLDYSSAGSSAYGLGEGLNVINNSYAYIGAATAGFDDLPQVGQSTVQHAQAGRALVVKSAGNDSRAIDGTTDGLRDVLANALIGAPSAVFVGALTRHGTPESQAPLASYSNRAGDSAQVQSQFLVVGVTGDRTGLNGTSFAAPIVSGYAAILGSKFTTATPTQIARQLLDTARTDTIQGYSPNVHGRGEASLSRALAPAALR